MAGSDGKGTEASLNQITHLAQQDLSQIHACTYETWVSDQADAYAGFLADEIRSLVLNPERGVPVQFREGVKVPFCGWRGAMAGHNIFYEQAVDGIIVLGVLHSSMNQSAHLVDPNDP